MRLPEVGPGGLELKLEEHKHQRFTVQGLEIPVILEGWRRIAKAELICDTTELQG